MINEIVMDDEGANVVRRIEVRLEKRGVSCVARLLDEEAPETADAVWNALPVTSPAYHAKYASNEVYCLIPPFDGDQPGLENSTVTPIPGDLVYFYFEIGHLSHAFRRANGFEGLPGVVDLAIFYGRNNLLLNPATGFVPGNVFATIEENLEGMAAACQDVWVNGFADEQITWSRLT